jgi:hypothetical protein
MKTIFGLPGGIVETVVGDAIGKAVGEADGKGVGIAVGKAVGLGAFVAGAVRIQLTEKIKSMASVITLFMDHLSFLLN